MLVGVLGKDDVRNRDGGGDQAVVFEESLSGLEHVNTRWIVGSHPQGIGYGVYPPKRAIAEVRDLAAER